MIFYCKDKKQENVMLFFKLRVEKFWARIKDELKVWVSWWYQKIIINF